MLLSLEARMRLICLELTGLNIASHKRDKIRFIQAVQFSFGGKTVLTRIISIVRVPSLYPNKDNTINRDDDA